MTLLAFLQAFTTQKISVTLSDPTGEIITFNSEGYEGVEADILAREVNSWGVASSKAISVQVAAIPKPAGSITPMLQQYLLTSQLHQLPLTSLEQTRSLLSRKLQRVQQLLQLPQLRHLNIRQQPLQFQ